MNAVMEKLGFSSKWVDLVMRCITSMSYSVLINGAACGNITPSRELQQEDPLSPTLFLICIEGLSTLIHEAARNIVGQAFLCVRAAQELLTFYLRMIAFSSVKLVLRNVKY